MSLESSWQWPWGRLWGSAGDRNPCASLVRKSNMSIRLSSAEVLPVRMRPHSPGLLSTDRNGEGN